MLSFPHLRGRIALKHNREVPSTNRSKPHHCFGKAIHESPYDSASEGELKASVDPSKINNTQIRTRDKMVHYSGI